MLRAGSLSGAARALRLTHPTLRRHIEALEAALGTALFTRSPAGLVPTAAALALRPAAEAMEAAAARLLRETSAEAEEAAGTVRITASEIVAVEMLPPLLAGLRARHPRLAFELVPSDATLDVLRRDADIAVRMARPATSGLVAQRLGAVSLGFFAQPTTMSVGAMPRRPASAAEKMRRVEASPDPGASVSLVARRHGANPNRLFT